MNRIDPLGLKKFNCHETRDILKKAFADSFQPGFDGLLSVLNNHKGNGKFDFKVNNPDDTFTIVNSHGKQHVLNAGQFGNFIAGYASALSGQASGITPPSGYVAVHLAGIGFDYVDAAINNLAELLLDGDPNPNNRFDFDAGSWGDIDAGYRQAIADLLLKDVLSGCP